MKVYTGSGDKGKTSLFSGERVSKSNPRVEAVGDVDELNAFLGLLAETLPRGDEARLREMEWIQSTLFEIGAWLSVSWESPAMELIEGITEQRVRFLEEAIDSMTGPMPPLKGFIVPGGHASAGMAHVARTVCRRAERHVVALSEAVEASRSLVILKETLVFLNRLSDYLFTLARYCNWSRGQSDKVWEK